MTENDPTTPDGIKFVHRAEAKAVSDGEEEPCVWCNHPDMVAERRGEIALHEGCDMEEVPLDRAKTMADYKFIFGDSESVDGGHRSVIYTCSMCMRGLPVLYGESSLSRLPYVWSGEVSLTVSYPSQKDGVDLVNTRVGLTEIGPFGANSDE